MLPLSPLIVSPSAALQIALMIISENNGHKKAYSAGAGAMK